MPNTRPDLHFDSSGICDACHSFEKKLNILQGINWEKRKKEFDLIIRKAKKIPEAFMIAWSQSAAEKTATYPSITIS